MRAAVFAFEDDFAPARRLADMLGVAVHPVHLHVFPDGESLPTVAPGHETALLYRSLAHPDGTLMPLLLAADALRRAGARRLVLVAPYLPYLRQDAVFAPGQPLSRDVLGRLLGAAFDRIVTVEPHLHRTQDLTAVFGGTPVTALSVAELFAHAIGHDGLPLIVGPDAESQAWTAAVAGRLGADWLVFEKTRRGDRDVTLRLPRRASVAGRQVALVDDICSSGGTLLQAVRAVHLAGARTIEAFVAHALFSRETANLLRKAGAASVVSTDSCAHPTNRIQLAGLLADALQDEVADTPRAVGGGAR
ncbi:MAG: ribose-phosphate diphosphokinase [Phenylobacterium sp.]